MEPATPRLDMSNLYAGAFCAGVAFHWAIARPFYIDPHAPQLIQLWLLGVLLIALVDGNTFSSHESPPLASLGHALGLCTLFNAGAFTSIAIYRLWFHRLRKFPGPTAAKLTRFWAWRQAAKTLQWHVVVQKLHEKHGDFVRIGPREVSINRASAIKKVYGPPSSLAKGSFYDYRSPKSSECSLHGLRNVQDHKQRRKAWDRGLGAKALTTYEPMVTAKADSLIAQLSKRQGEAVNARKWGYFYGFDVMGQIGLGRDFGMTESGEEHPSVRALYGFMYFIGVISLVPWFARVMTRLPIPQGDADKFKEFCAGQLDEKIEVSLKIPSHLLSSQPQSPDVLSWILETHGPRKTSSLGRMALEDEAQLLIIAGSDTTSGTLTSALFLLARSPEKAATLRKALDDAFPRGEADWSYAKLKDVKYLDNVINETLRMKPAVVSGMQRETPAAGLQVDEMYIPGGVLVSVPAHVVHYDPRNFYRPREFLPERWESVSTPEDMPFIPFSRGAYSCAGKQFALMELRIALAKIVLEFDFDFHEGQSEEAFDTGYHDLFTVHLPDLLLDFKKRAPSKG
ncbi:cytochrome P450 [Xylariomycetidae sp. FL0641]|nr:cytochrome P450 [Xylariomycetidae sp. FL0641]